MRKQNGDIELLEKLKNMPYHKMSPSVKSRMFKSIKDEANRYENSYAKKLKIKRLAAGFVCCAALLLLSFAVFTPGGQEYAGKLWSGVSSLIENKTVITPSEDDDGADALKNFILTFYTVNQSDYDYYKEIEGGATPEDLHSYQMSYETYTKKFEQYLSQKSYDNFYNTRLSTGRIAIAFNSNIYAEVKNIKLDKFREDKDKGAVGYHFELQLNYTNKDTKKSELVTRFGTLSVAKEDGNWKIVDLIGPPNIPFPGTGSNNVSTPSPYSYTLPNLFYDSPLISIHMTDDNSGWALTHESVLHTSDGGSTWKKVTPGGYKGASGSKGFFLDGSHGWVAEVHQNSSPVIYRTTDAGKSWNSVSVNIQGFAADIQFFNQQNGIVMLHQGAGMHHEEITLLKTEDGGASWSIFSKTDPQDGKANGLPFAGNKTGFYFKDMLNGFLTGEIPMDGYTYIYKTNNGGSSWIESSITVPDTLKEAYLTTLPPIFFNDMDGLLPVRVSLETQSIIFFKTTDGGAAWTAGQLIPDSPDNKTIWDFADKKYGFAVSDNKLLKTSDGGLTWNIIRGTDLLHITHMDFISPETGWIVEDGTLYKTDDGADTWKKSGN